MNPYRKKLIEVALPLEAINIASAREKSIRHGHPSTLHLWWARRPLAACRAVLFASLVDDPDSDPVYAKYDAETREHMAGEKRQQLFNLITELVQWDNSNNELIINATRAEIARCVASRKVETGELKKDHKLKGGETVYDLVVKGHGDLEKLRKGIIRLPNAESVNAFLADHAPPVLDPFCGGGSIPFEAQRLGLRAFASDLNPVPVLITKALIEIPPKYANKPPVNPESRGEAGPAGHKGQGRGKSVTGKSDWRGAQGLAEDVRYYGKWMRNEAEKLVGHLYPNIKVTADMAKARPDLKRYVGEDLRVLAWLWARTVASPNPAVTGAHVPLVRSFLLASKPGKEAWVDPVIDSGTNSYRFEVRVGQPTSRPVTEAGTKLGRGCKFKCLLSNQPISDDHVKSEGMSGRLGERLMAIVAEGQSERVYLSPNPEHEAVAAVPQPKNIAAIEAPIALDKRAIWCLLYGLDRFDKLFTARQLNALATFSDLVQTTRAKVIADQAELAADSDDNRPLDQGGEGHLAYADAVATYLAFGVDRSADFWSSLCTWANQPKNELVAHVFGRQGLPMIWDFAEANPFCDSGGNFLKNLDFVIKAITASIASPVPGSVRQLDAAAAILELPSPLVSTDPPYYDNIGYADLSDFFYVWIRRSIQNLFPSVLSTVLTPKAQELIASPYRHDGDVQTAAAFFETGLGQAFENIRARHTQDYPFTVYYAFKQAETSSDDADGEPGLTASTGWETMLEGLVKSGWLVDGTWPIRSERPTGMKGAVNALASSIVLVCRQRPANAPLATRREFLNTLKRELPVALRHLQRGNIAPVDLAQASIGPGMAVFTRYAKVMEADGSPMKVRQALALINQTLDEVLAEQEGEFDTDTRWALAWFEQYGLDNGPSGEADVLCRAKNTAINALERAGIVQARAGKTRLLKRDELPADWNPATDNKVRHWEVTQHLIRRLETGGEPAAATLLRQLGGMGEVARDLAYRLYNLCERKKWASEALAYNGLVIAWPEISKLAQQPAPVERQGEQMTFA